MDLYPADLRILSLYVHLKVCLPAFTLVTSSHVISPGRHRAFSFGRSAFGRHLSGRSPPGDPQHSQPLPVGPVERKPTAELLTERSKDR
jgi:hypothetical protein